jgi:hypothetical protein
MICRKHSSLGETVIMFKYVLIMGTLVGWLTGCTMHDASTPPEAANVAQ